jgi:hypothetical protein
MRPIRMIPIQLVAGARNHLRANRPLEFRLCRTFTLGEESSYRGRRGGG